jgi:hypothetical protein
LQFSGFRKPLFSQALNSLINSRVIGLLACAGVHSLLVQKRRVLFDILTADTAGGM